MEELTPWRNYNRLVSNRVSSLILNLDFNMTSIAQFDQFKVLFPQTGFTVCLIKLFCFDNSGGPEPNEMCFKYILYLHF